VIEVYFINDAKTRRIFMKFGVSKRVIAWKNVKRSLEMMDFDFPYTGQGDLK